MVAGEQEPGVAASAASPPSEEEAAAVSVAGRTWRARAPPRCAVKTPCPSARRDGSVVARLLRTAELFRRSDAPPSSYGCS
jgi:hypothetical protein